jgi:hypothetical protein
MCSRLDKVVGVLASNKSYRKRFLELDLPGDQSDEWLEAMAAAEAEEDSGGELVKEFVRMEVEQRLRRAAYKAAMFARLSDYEESDQARRDCDLLREWQRQHCHANGGPIVH